MKHIEFSQEELRRIPSFGVAGNFTGHLEQAGEARDFAAMKTADVSAPKAIFPTYIPAADGETQGKCPAFLHTFPFDSQKIIFPVGEEKIQIEPECALVFNAEWSGGRIVSLSPLCFGASNDCSIRKEGAKKISLKKNWGASSKGFYSTLLALDDFSADSALNDYRIASFLIRGGQIFDYGEDSAVRSYSYIWKRLTDWMLEKLNSQRDEGPAEDIHSYLVEAGMPERIMISIGATRYTDWGQKNFLHTGDVAVVVLYPESSYSHDAIKDMAMSGTIDADGVSGLYQRIC